MANLMIRALRRMIHTLATEAAEQVAEHGDDEYRADYALSLEVNAWDALRLLEAAHRWWEHPEGDDACDACDALDALREATGDAGVDERALAVVMLRGVLETD